MKNNQLNKEEKLLQQKLNQISVSYNPSHWEEMQDKLQVRESKSSSLGNYVKLAAAFMTVSLVSYLVLINYNSGQKQAVEEKGNIIEQREPNKEHKVEANGIVLLEDSVKTSTKHPQEEGLLPENEDEGLLVTQDSLAEEFIDSIFELSESSKKLVSTDTLNEIGNATGKTRDLVIMYSEYPCLYSSIYFTVKNKADFKEIKWKIDGEYFSGEYKFFEAGKYLVSVSAKKDGKNYTDSTLVLVDESESFDFTYEQMQGLFDDFKVQFKSQSDTRLTWLIEDHEITAQQPSFEFPKEGLYDVTAYTVNERGCTTEVYKPVSVVQDFQLYAASAFTPNGDGLNDGFLPPVLKDIEYPYSLSIYTAAGKELFSTTQKGLEWNGKYMNDGESLPIGNYIWKVAIWNAKGKQRQFMGQVKIVDFD